ncbi:MAG: hypothetical protein JF887_02140 [Candidatus Dormibacteraeota bacterium]|uniref:DUF11 domain-containing protein n=1 Tax=Candidatus Amunia macphersoniae TaxID=3127014 RepID=A0A934KI52_9BACT|nr:hypothetical protein [Candidatus Dormibacteraeota bacterium]
MNTGGASVDARASRIARVPGLRMTRWMVAGLAGGAAALLVTTSALADPLVSESFTHSTVSDPNFHIGGSNFTPCLTAGTNTSQTPVPGCALGTPDSDGAGTFRITDANLQEAGFILFNRAQPFTAGLTVDFDFFMYGGSTPPADGISFFLVDGATDLTKPGQPGGSLGYSTFGGMPGVNNGFLGVGLDEFGNFERDFFSGTGCTPTANVSGPNSVGIRGPGNGTAGYCLLATNSSLPGALHGGSIRSGALRRAHIVVDPSNLASPHVTLSIDFGSGLQQLLQTALPPNPPATYKFGFAGSTGSFTDVHEIRNLVSSTQQQLPQLALQKTHSGSFTAGGSGTFLISASISGSGGTERTPVTVNDPLPSGLTVASPPSGSGWDCSATVVGSTSASCTTAASQTAPIAAGTTLPLLSVPVSVAQNAPATETNVATVTSTDASNAPVSASDTVAIAPAAAVPESPATTLLPIFGVLGGLLIGAPVLRTRRDRRRLGANVR